MSSPLVKSTYWRGVRNGLPFVVVVIPFAMVFGVVAREAGLNITELTAMSVLVIGGASQFAALQLMGENAPNLIVLLTALAVNLRMAMYSASLAVHLGPAPFWQRAIIAYLNVDQSYAVSTVEYERHPGMTLNQKVAYFLGAITPVAPTWYVMSWVGGRFGALIPETWAIDFAMPITFLAMLAPMMRSIAHVTAALVSVVMALSLAWVPLGMGLLLAAFLAMIAGAQVEKLMQKSMK